MFEHLWIFIKLNSKRMTENLALCNSFYIRKQQYYNIKPKRNLYYFIYVLTGWNLNFFEIKLLWQCRDVSRSLRFSCREKWIIKVVKIFTMIWIQSEKGFPLNCSIKSFCPWVSRITNITTHSYTYKNIYLKCNLQYVFTVRVWEMKHIRVCVHTHKHTMHTRDSWWTTFKIKHSCWWKVFQRVKSLALSLNRSIPLQIITPQYSLELETAFYSHHLNTSIMYTHSSDRTDCCKE